MSSEKILSSYAGAYTCTPSSQGASTACWSQWCVIQCAQQQPQGDSASITPTCVDRQGTAPGWAERGCSGGSGCQLGAAARQGRSSSNGEEPLSCKQQSWSSMAVLQHEQLEQPCDTQAWVNAGDIMTWVIKKRILSPPHHFTCS